MSAEADPGTIQPRLRPLQIGPYRLSNNLVLAPMAGVSDRPYRMLCRRLGAGLAVSEMVSSDTSLRGTRKSVRRLDFAGETGPIAVQIVGTDPNAMAEAARRHLDLGAQIIDINMGCPAKKVCRVAAGAALLRDESLVGRILSAVVSVVDAPVTLKIRTGWSPESRNAPTVARIAEDCGIAALAVHGRTGSCGYGVPAEYETIRALRHSIRIPLIANGDIDCPERAREVLDWTGADAIMLGRGAQGRPWIFRQIATYLTTGVTPPAPPGDWIRDLLLEHLDLLYDFYGTHAGLRIARKHIAWYCHDRPGAARLRERINRAENPRDQRGLVADFYNKTDRMENGAA
ncbi:MAG: tRNA dihydrouridine synthase DusB [Bdellovibrio bacteriovorus]